MELIQQLNHEALTHQDSSQALSPLTQALELLHYQANCGKVVERNLIVTVLYNLAAVNQALCNIEKAAEYLEACIYNMQEMIQNETNNILLIKRMHFLSLIQLQYSGLLAQLGQHQLSSNMANSTILIMHELFDISCQYKDSQSNATRQVLKQYKGEYVYEEFDFKTLLLKRADELLKFTKSLLTQQESTLQDLGNLIFREKQLKIIKNKLSPRSMIGLLNENEWLTTFSISNVLFMRMLTYEEVCLKGEILYEFSQRVLIEKLLLLSVAYFTLATENRILKKEKPEIHHLKSISIVANILPEQTPYLEHIVSTFLSYYHPHLETIVEEQSFVDQSQKVSIKKKQSLLQNKENCQNDHLKQLIDSLSKDKLKKQESIQKTLNQLQSLKNKLNKSKQDLSLKRFKTEPSVHFEKNEKNNRQILQLLKQ